jgi:hypothetical protein
MSSGQLTLKAGDTLLQDGLITEDDGVTPVDLTGSTLTAQIRLVDGGSPSGLLASLTVVVTNAALGQFTVGATAAATLAWPPGRYTCDLRLQDAGGDVLHSESFGVWVQPAVTAP